VFERFTDRARRVVVLAQEESRELGHDHIGTEHLLLGLVRETEGIAAQALAALDVDLDVVRARVEERIGHGSGQPKGHIPFTPRAKKVLEMSLREALQLKHDYIGTEHILLGLLREGEGVACQVLMNMGVTLDVARQEVIGLLATMGEADAVAAERGGGAGSGRTPFAAARRLGRASSSGARLRRNEGEPERTPVCPTCDADLSSSLRHRIQVVPHGSEDGAPRRQAGLLYCAECGRVLAADLLGLDLEGSQDAGETDSATGTEAEGGPGEPGDAEGAG